VTIAAAPGIVLAGCLRNAAAVARAADAAGARIGVVPAGERWPDRSLRPAIEDWLGAGAIISGLAGARSPEAELAVAAFEEARARLPELLAASVSGRELAGWGFAGDVALAADLDAGAAVPAFEGDRYRALAPPVPPPLAVPGARPGGNLR
jgi:2-phosphosulfolactate phosphatase